MPCDLQFERQCWADGHALVAGGDEAGRGPLAGPVVAGAVILPDGFEHAVLTDSKKLSPKVRESLYEELTHWDGLRWASAKAEPKEIDQINILKASHVAMARAVEALPSDAVPEMVLIDGLRVPNFPYPQTPIVKGDSLSLSIAAASIIAKVERDREMVAMDAKYPGYGFAKHKGYPTKQHLQALQKLGPCPIHRRSFGPVAQLNLDFS